MARKNQNPELIDIKFALKELKRKEEAEIERCNEIHDKYYRMEGKYGKIAHDVWDDMMHCRSYHYEYPSEEIKQKEKDERKQFLIDNNWKSLTEIWHEYETLRKPLKERECQIEHGMSVAEWNIVRRINQLNGKIDDHYKEIKEFKEHIARLKAELEDIRDTNA